MTMQEYLDTQIDAANKAITERIIELQKTDPTLISLIASLTTLTNLKNAILAGEAQKTIE